MVKRIHMPWISRHARLSVRVEEHIARSAPRNTLFTPKFTTLAQNKGPASRRALGRSRDYTCYHICGRSESARTIISPALQPNARDFAEGAVLRVGGGDLGALEPGSYARSITGGRAPIRRA